MDFSLIERHPWVTTGIVIGGGFLLYVTLRGRGGSSSSGTQYVGVDPATANAQAQAGQAQSQADTYIRGLQLQGATQISLAQIGADVSMFGVERQSEVMSTDTAARLALGLSTNSAIIEQARINAGLQNHYIDAVVAAFTGGGYQNNPATQNPPIYSPTPSYPNPGQTPPPSYVTYSPPTGTGGNYPTSTGGVNPYSLVPGAAPLPGGTEVAMLPSYADCNPRDVSCVMRNQSIGIAYRETVSANQTINNRNQCLANAERSRGYANYDSLVAAC